MNRNALILALKEKNVSHPLIRDDAFSPDDGSLGKFAIGYSDSKGLYLRANADFAIGDIILKECPVSLAIESKYFGKYCQFCTGELSPKEIKMWRSSKSNDPNCVLCEGCSANNYVRDINNMMHRNDIKVSSKTENEKETDVGLYLMFFRLLLGYGVARSCQLDDDILFFDSSFTKFLAYDEDTVKPDLECDIKLIAKVLRDIIRGLGRSKEEIGALDHIIKMCKICLCNQHAVMSNDGADIGRAFCPIAAMINHSCEPNLSWQIGTETGGIMVCKALRNIKTGDELTISYLNPTLLDNHSPKSRRKILMAERGFFCSCVKCRNYCENCQTSNCKSTCARCRSTWYCSSECQKSDWPLHKTLCKIHRAPKFTLE